MKVITHHHSVPKCTTLYEDIEREEDKMIDERKMKKKRKTVLYCLKK
jgi:hypothetical protein